LLLLPLFFLKDPGKVFKGKKMAGRMGGKRRTVQSCQVWRVDPQRNLIYVRGQVPGHKGNFVFVRDAVRKQVHDQPPLPVPSITEGEVGEVTVAEKQGTDPFEYKE
jgi:large subunit ribosomal protein L3